MGITVLLVFLLLMLDQTTKYLAQMLLVENSTNFVGIPHVLELRLIYNRGAAWGMLENNTPVLAIISLIASIVLGYYILKNNWKKNKLLSFSLTLAFAGCVGNLFDRFISITSLKSGRCGVVDMISLNFLDYISEHLFNSSFPVFNLADAYLVVGLILFILDYIFIQGKKNKND